MTTDGRPPQDAVRTGADRPSPSRTRGERDLRLGPGGCRGRPRPAPDRGPRPGPVATGVRGGPARGPGVARVRRRRGPGAPVRRRRPVRRRARATPRGEPRLRLRLHAVDVRGVGARPRPPVARAGLPGRVPRAWPGRAGRCGSRSAAAPNGGWTASSGRARTRWRAAAATCPSATATATGRTGSRSSSTTSARASTWSSAGATCSAPRPPRSASAGCSAARRRRRSRITRSSAATDGRKLSKADGATSVRDLRAAGATAPELIGRAAAAVGLIEAPRPIEAADVATLVGG